MAVALTLLLFAVFVVIGLGLYWYREGRRSAIEAPTVIPEAGQCAVVLCHGLLGFDHVETPLGRQAYFRGVAELLRAHGAAVYACRVPPLGTVPQRAERLAAHVRGLAERRIILIGHSMGGLDARYAVSKLGLASQVDALITVGTPHRGSSLANHANALPLRTMRGALRYFGLTTDALEWLGEASSDQFNTEVADVGRVRYGSIVGETGRRQLRGNPLLLALYELLLRTRGPNDCLVPASSQRWGKDVRVVRAHHLAQVGWSPGFDAPAMYLGLLRQLHTGGLPCLPGAPLRSLLPTG